jgi:antitoxin PrlF
MKRTAGTRAARSRVSVKAQTVIPREVRDALGIRAGDVVVWEFTERGIVIGKALAAADDPFISFTEWAGKKDDDAYSDL